MSAPARMAALASILPPAIGLAVWDGDWAFALGAVAVAGAGQAWGMRPRRGARAVRTAALLAIILIAAYFLTGWALGSLAAPLSTPRFALGAAALAAFLVSGPRQLQGWFLFTLVALYWSAADAFGWGFGALAAIWLGSLLAYHHLATLESLGLPGALPGRPAQVALGSCLAAGSFLFALLPQPITPALGPLFVTPPDQSGTPAAPLSAPLRVTDAQPLGTEIVLSAHTPAWGYWRGQVFDTYASGSWTRAALSSVPVATQTWPPYEAGRSSQGSYLQTFKVVRPLPGVLLAAAPVQSLYYPHGPARVDAYSTLMAPSRLSAGTLYSAVSYLPDFTVAQLAGAGAAVAPRGSYLTVPALSPAAERLEPATAGRSRLTLALIVTRLLKADPGSASLAVEGGTGDSVQLASAEVLLLRGLGIPARLATGYAPSRYDVLLGEAEATASDWHAWVEVWFGEFGWVPFDPSPGFLDMPISHLQDRLSLEGLGALVPNRSDLLPIVATPTAVASRPPAPRPSANPSPPPTAAVTVAPTPAITPAPTPTLAAATHKPAAPPSPPAAASPSTAQLLLVPLLPLVALLLVAALVVMLTRPRRPAEPQAELLALYEQLQRRLPRVRRPGETPTEYERALLANDAQAALLREMTELVINSAFREQPPEPERLIHLQGMIGDRPRR